MQIHVPVTLDNGIGKNLWRILPIGYQYRVQAVVGSEVIPSSGDQSGMILVVGINQQDTIIWRSSATKQACHAESDVGGGCRFPDTPLCLVSANTRVIQNLPLTNDEWFAERLPTLLHFCIRVALSTPAKLLGGLGEGMISVRK